MALQVWCSVGIYDGSQPLPIMPLHHICKAIPVLYPVILYHPYITDVYFGEFLFTYLCYFYRTSLFSREIETASGN